MTSASCVRGFGPNALEGSPAGEFLVAPPLVDAARIHQPFLPLPRQEILDLLPKHNELEAWTRRLELGQVVPACRTMVNAFGQEAFITAFFKTLEQRNSYKAHLADVDYSFVRKSGLGLPKRGAFRTLWCVVRDRVETLGWASPAESFLLWGSPMTQGRVLEAIVGGIARSPSIRKDLDHPLLEGVTIADLIEPWARGSGVTHPKTLGAIEALAREVDLKMRPEMLDLPISMDDLDFARSVSGTDPRLALAFARCLMRVRAHTRGRLCMWRSGWLRGTAAHADAIPGVSTFAAELNDLLKTYVLSMVKGWSAGRTAAIYEVVREIRSGPVDAARAARELGLELDSKGRAKPA